MPFHITPVALSVISVLVPCAALLAYLLSLRNKSTATKWLVGGIFLALFMFLFSLPRTILPRPHPMWIYFTDFSLLFSLGTLTLLIQHGYHHPRIREEHLREARLALLFSCLLIILLSIVSLSSFTILSFGFYELYQIVLVLHILKWNILYFRQLLFYARKANVVGWRQIWLVPQEPIVQAFRAFILIAWSPFMGVGVILWSQIGTPSSNLVELVMMGVLAFILFTGMYILMNHLVEPTNLLYKLTSLAFLLLCMLSNGIALFTYPILSAGYIPAQTIASGQQYRFEREGDSAYHLQFVPSSTEGRIDDVPMLEALGEPLLLKANDLQEIKLHFPFPFYEQVWNSFFLTEDGYIVFGAFGKVSGHVFPVITADNSMPFIAPLLVNFYPSEDEKVDANLYVTRFEDGITITWHQLNSPGQNANTNPDRRGSNTVRLTLWANGDIKFSYPQINLVRTLETDMSLQNWLIGISPGNRTNTQEMTLLPGVDLRVKERVALFQNFSTEALVYTHHWLWPFALMNVLAGLLILIGFPLFLRYTLLKPLSRLMNNIERVDAGDLSITTSVQSHDEIGFLTGAFNRMISSIRKGQHELEVINAVLEDRIQQRTEQLALAKEEAETANLAKSRFLANMSHELRTPLNAILGFAQILQRRYPTLAHLQTIDQSGKHLLTLINEILDLARVEAGKITLEPRPFHLIGFLDGLREIMQGQTAQKGLVLHCRMHPDLPTYIEADEARLRQILINLWSNAIKFTERGAITVEAKLMACFESEEPSQGSKQCKLHFQIEDTGSGMAEEDRVAIFEPFYQSNTTAAKEGAGLGLAICRQLLMLMGSELHVISQQGHGSTFWFDIVVPFEPSPTLEHSNPAPSRAAVVGIEEPFPTILVVDDRAENRTLLVELFAPMGFQLLEAEDGYKGLEQALAARPEVVITDLVMPKMDGLEFIRQLRKPPELADLLIIAVSASAFQEDAQKSMAAGGDLFLPKPLQIDPLLEFLEQRLSVNWIYDDGPLNGQNKNQMYVQGKNQLHNGRQQLPVETGAHHLPPVESLSIMFNAAQIGDIQAVLDEADALSQINADYLPFVEQVLYLAQTFQVRRLSDWLAGLIDPSPA